MQLSQPTQSFQELQLELNIPLEQLYRIAAHLIYWRKAKLIDKITLTNIYRCDSPVVYQNLFHEFSKLFPAFSLGEFLQIFATPRELSEVIPSSNQRGFIQVVVWLLQRDLLVQLHEFVYLIPRLENASAAEQLIEDLHVGPSKYFSLFKRLLVYFNGDFPVQEILWRENISRKKFNKVVEKYRSLLIIVIHENKTGRESICLRL